MKPNLITVLVALLILNACATADLVGDVVLTDQSRTGEIVGFRAGCEIKEAVDAIGQAHEDGDMAEALAIAEDPINRCFTVLKRGAVSEGVGYVVELYAPAYALPPRTAGDVTHIQTAKIHAWNGRIIYTLIPVRTIEVEIEDLLGV